MKSADCGHWVEKEIPLVAKRQHDYKKIIELCKVLLAAGVKPEWAHLARRMELAESTIKNILHAEGYDHPRELLGGKADEGIPTYNKLEDGDKINHTHEGSYDEYVSVSVSGQIKSVEDLIRVCEVDTDKYIIVEPQFRKWDVTLKLHEKGDGDRVVVVPQIYVAFKTIARHPDPIMPVISPIEIQLTEVSKPRELHGKLHRALIVPDVHIGFRRRIHSQELTPFHDRRVLDLVTQIIEGGWFDDVIFIGDCLDFSEFSTKFTPEPEFYYTTQPALIEWAWWLASIRTITPEARIIQFEGNHDKRLESMVVSYMRAAYGLRPVDELEMSPSLSTERLLALHQTRVEYIKGYPDNILWINQNVMVRHGDVVRAGPGDSAKAVINKTTYTTIFGHVHRRELVSRRIKSRDGDVIQHAICPGCACHIDGRVPGSTADQQWQQGLAAVEYTDSIENIIPISVDEGVAIYNGKIFKARNRDAEVNKMLMKNLEKIK